MSQIAAILFNGLKREEGFRPFVYDDATDENLKQGDSIAGNPTIGYGFCLSKKPLTEKQAASILQDHCADTEKWCIENLKYWPNLSLVRQYAVACIVYQLGGAGWLKFVHANYYLAQDDYDSAYVEILNSDYAKQTPNRAQRMAGIIREDKLVDYYV